MNEPTRSGDTFIYTGVTLNDLESLLQSEVITVKDLYYLMKYKELRKDNIQIYMNE